MALPRSKYVKEGKEGVYHCFSRCVRRALPLLEPPLQSRRRNRPEPYSLVHPLQIRRDLVIPSINSSIIDYLYAGDCLA